MVLKEFRINHSTLIEHYQYIEAHLEGIYAAISGKPFGEGVKEVEKNSISGVVREIKEVEREKHLQVFSEEEYTQLRQLIERRNFWCHCCYFEMPFDLKTGGPAKVRDVQVMFEDMRTAEAWRKQLFDRKIELLKKNRQS